MNAREVEQSKRGGFRWKIAGIVDVVTELVRCAEFEEGCVHEERPVPFLRK